MRICLAIAGIVLFAANLSAQEKPADVHELSPEQAAAINFAYGGQLGYRYADHCRAGFAQSVRMRSLPATSRYYGGYLVGGGAPFFGEGRYEDEGTFGWDYFGLIPKRVALNWTHGREQGNGGTYKTDGPKREHK